MGLSFLSNKPALIWFWIVGWWLLRLCASLLINSVEIVFVFCHMFIFSGVDWRCAKQNEVYSCILVLLHSKELWQMVRVGGGEVKSKAKGKEEHDEAEQEQLGRMILTIMIIDIMMKCSRKKWSFMALLATHFFAPLFFFHNWILKHIWNGYYF